MIIQNVPLNVEPNTVSSGSSSELTSEKLVSHEVDHCCRMLVCGFRVTWDTVYVGFPVNVTRNNARNHYQSVIFVLFKQENKIRKRHRVCLGLLCCSLFGPATRVDLLGLI